jgi:very-short-patch-repair endonuclease
VAIRGIVTGQKIGSTKAELAKRLRREMTPAERLLWRALRGSSLNGVHFRRQQIVAGFVADFYCHSSALVVEVDGWVHEEQRVSDARRDAILSGLGLRVLRVSNDEVMSNVDGVLQKIAENLTPGPFPEGKGRCKS